MYRHNPWCQWIDCQWYIQALNMVPIWEVYLIQGVNLLWHDVNRKLLGVPNITCGGNVGSLLHWQSCANIKLLANMKVLDNRDFLVLDLFDTDVHRKLLGTGDIWYTSLMNDTVFRKLHPWLSHLCVLSKAPETRKQGHRVQVLTIL